MKKSENCFIKRTMLLIMLLMPAYIYAQENPEGKTVAPEKEYVRATFENGVVINNQTTENVGRKSLDFMIQHRFGIIENVDDLGGLFAPSNIRLGLTYGITDRISVGIGATKNKMLYDFQGKLTILKQTKGKGCPVTLAYYGDVARSAQAKDKFLNQEGDFKGANKVSYFHELMVARKLNSKISLQLAATYSYFNLIDSLYDEHAFYGASFVGRYKFSPQSSVIVDMDYLLNVSNIDKSVRPKPNLSLGFEVSTGSHQFQIFVCTAGAIINQENRVFNTNDFTDFKKRDFMLGFNITRSWGFNK